MPRPSLPTIALIGAGPRGVSLLERIGATLAEQPGAPLAIHVVDDTEIGAGRVWRTDQPRELCMNTLADAVTLFTDESATIDGAIRPGPTLFEWCVLVRDRADRQAASAASIARIAADRVAVFDRTPVRPGLADDYRDELAALVPHSHPSRALYGEYCRWCFAAAVAGLPASVEIDSHLARATAIARRAGREVVALDDGTELVADAVVLATGWMPRRATAAERGLLAAVAAHPGLVWVRPDSPIDQELDSVPDRADVIVRGLGMGFFDAMALLTVGRGGRFVDDPDAPGGLRYEQSGREPVLHATSPRGVPYRAKSLYGSLPPRAPQRHLRGLDAGALPRPADFDEAVWPLVLKDAFADYHDTLHRVRPDAVTGSLTDLQAAIDASDGTIEALAAAVAPFVPDVADRFDLAAALDPAAGRFDSPAAFDAWVRAYLADDLAEAELGRDSALKAGLWSIGSARRPASALGAFGGYDAESRAGGFRRLHSVGGMFGSGPPAFRNRQLLALAAAGIVHFIGPRAQVTASDGVFRAASPVVAGSEVEATVLVDAWMHAHDVSASADPLVHSLLAAGRARAFAVSARSGEPVPTGGFDIDPETGLLVHPDGTVDPAVHVAGIPLDELTHDTIISPMPGTDPAMLRETDRVARSALRIAEAARRTSGRSTT
ncbi:FAD/NAD(P)-binding protein [Microbacterium sp.]|uniref:FAD/NAD(P)-binding protein n=1 Tax=Microbacterium sp. TaxID=51671 RepID=UPI0039E6ADBE